MFAARDQENLVHAHQTTAAGKPLNQGVRALQPKTPGNNFKTPFQARNNENKPLGTRKADKNVFVTPAPRNRAPLGAKTTNVKAQPFKTPGPTQKNAFPEKELNKQSTGRRSLKSKIIVAPSEPTEANVLDQKEEEDDEPDFGYAPPPEVPMPDPPIEFTYDQTFPQFRAENMYRGWGEVYLASPVDENGMSIRLKKEEEAYRKSTERQEQELLKQVEAQNQRKLPDPDDEVAAMIARGPKIRKTGPSVQQSRVNTIKARSAADALSNTSQNASVRPTLLASKDTVSSKQKKKPAFTVSKDNGQPVKPQRSAPPPVSKNTIGFPKAKKAPSILPSPQRVRSKPSSTSRQLHMDPREFVKLYGQPPVESEMWLRLQSLELDGEDDDAKEEQSENALFDFDLDMGPFQLDGIDNVDDFQLPMPEE